MSLAGLPLFDAVDRPSGVPADVCDLFERFASDLKGKGFDRYSADAILHRIRWHQHVDRGNRDFKCNNNWTAPLARWVMSRHASMRGFFELRERRAA